MYLIRKSRGQYLIPARVAHVVLAALVVCALLNALGTFLCEPKGGAVSETTVEVVNGLPVRLPIEEHRVALEIVDSDRYGMEDDNDWASVIPVGHGFVRMGEDADAFYAVSMYHQMHCLNSFRKMFNGHRNASRAGHDGAHALHCLTYLRQNVLCAADASLEPAFTARNVDGRRTKAAYGSEVTHRCGDWVRVREYVEKNYEEWKEMDDFVHTEASAINAI
ncbi:hypothetical protein OF83DRAFT_1084571 [Amylostereum chailletii]|nr:hypothetical protein OF83DRAFT_1084571 [Amylostereum chailletii]